MPLLSRVERHDSVMPNIIEWSVDVVVSCCDLTLTLIIIIKRHRALRDGLPYVAVFVVKDA